MEALGFSWRWPARLVGVAAAGVLVASAGAASAATAPPQRGGPTAVQPVPSLTPAATQRLWRDLVRRARLRSLSTAECSPLRAVFYAATDWLRLTTKLAANASPCAQYYVSVPPLVADKTQPRADQAWRIRALGPAFHALAEINVTGWTSWVATTGSSWYEAGVEARRRMAAAGYDVAAGDTWALNELSSAVRQGTGNARANMRAFLRGLHDGDGALPVARGSVFVIGLAQTTSDLSVYQARLQDWYEDAEFWSDLSRYALDWSQELYGDVRTYAVPGMGRDARRDALNEYLQHEAALAAVAPASAEAARSFLAAAYSPLANAAWRYDAAFGWTDVDVELMQDYVSAQTYAVRAAGSGRFGFAWSPRNLAGIPSADFNAQTGALLDRLAAAITDSADTPEAACGTAWCTRELEGAAVTTAWRTFAAWKPSVLAFATPAQTLSPGEPSAPITVELRTASGTPYTAGLPVTVELASSSPAGELAPAGGGPWSTKLTATIASGASTTTFWYRDGAGGSAIVTAAAAGRTAATQAVTVVAQPVEPPPPTPPPPAPQPLPPAPSSGGGGGAGPDLVIGASAAPGTPAVGTTVTYVVSVRNLGSPASRAYAHVQLPAQATYAGSESDRGPGCTGTTALTCDVDFLSGDLVATVRIHAVVREAGTLTLTARSSSEPGDVQPANDSASVVVLVAQRDTPRAPAVSAAPALRVVSRTPAVVVRRGKTAEATVRFRVATAARLQARVTPLRSTRALTLLAGTTLAGRRSAAARATATAAVARDGTYTLRARLRGTALVRERTYLVRLTAVNAAGARRTLVIRVRA